MLDQHVELDLFSIRLLKQQFAGRYIASLGHISLILNESVFTPWCACLMVKQQMSIL